MQIFIVLELITGGELFDKIVAEGRFDENTARFYFRQLIKGLKYCHGQGVCHRDLKVGTHELAFHYLSKFAQLIRKLSQSSNRFFYVSSYFCSLRTFFWT